MIRLGQNVSVILCIEGNFIFFITLVIQLLVFVPKRGDIKLSKNNYC